MAMLDTVSLIISIFNIWYDAILHSHGGWGCIFCFASVRKYYLWAVDTYLPLVDSRIFTRISLCNIWYVSYVILHSHGRWGCIFCFASVLKYYLWPVDTYLPVNQSSPNAISWWLCTVDSRIITRTVKNLANYVLYTQDYIQNQSFLNHVPFWLMTLTVKN